MGRVLPGPPRRDSHLQPHPVRRNPDRHELADWRSAPPDTTAPVRSSGSPSGTLAARNSQTTLSLATNESATCRYTTTAGTAYARCRTWFPAHRRRRRLHHGERGAATAPLQFTSCAADSVGNINPDDTISFSIATPAANTTAPVRSSGSPSGTLAGGTTQTTMSVTTNESATCRNGVRPAGDGVRLDAEHLHDHRPRATRRPSPG